MEEKKNPGAVGIICEFNPFHSGHAYLIRQAREKTGARYVVCVMSGDFVQRGGPAIVDKYARTRMALDGGADLVFELPLRFSLSSAGDFALGGILALSSLGFVTDLCFGSEGGEIRPFLEIARHLHQEPEDFSALLQKNLREGLSFPAARARALSELLPISEKFLRQPNNILGVEYCLAILKTGASLAPHTILRLGQTYHDEALPADSPHPSAAALRNEMYQSDVPHMTADDFSEVVGYALLTAENLAGYKDISPELSERFLRLLPDYAGFSDFVERCQTKNFTAGRIRRALFQCLFGIFDQPASLLHPRLFGISDQPASLPYLRLLGMKKEASFLLKNGENSKKENKNGRVNTPILSRLAADAPRLDPQALALLRQDILASDLYRQIWSQKYRAELPNEYQRSPIVV